MSYVKAEDILPRELIEAIQQYVDGRSIYIPTKEKTGLGNEDGHQKISEGKK